jgi:hypothetical protein
MLSLPRVIPNPPKAGEEPYVRAIAADVAERIAVSVWTRLRTLVVHEHRKIPLSPGGEFGMTRSQGLVAGFPYS